MAESIAQWLEKLGLGQYTQAFADNGVELDHLPHLTDDDLKELGLPLGPRRHLQAAVQTLSANQPPIRASTPSPHAAGARPAEAERRQLTVLFCDLVGSTELTARLDPEDMGRVLRDYQNVVGGEVTRFEGHVAKFMGDGVLAYFGWPTAHEDEAERAVRAGLALVGAVGRLATPAGEPIAARIGIATGMVVVGELIGEGAAQEQAVVGETPNLAARLQGLAAPGGVVISRRTRRLVGGLFELADLDPQHLKGFAEPMEAWRVVGISAAENRFEAMHPSGLTPLVGREHELGLLLDRWDLAKGGEGQVVLLSGEPGIGKSRLAQAMHERLAAEPHLRLRYYCSPFHVNSALFPVIDQLERAAGFHSEDTPEAKLDKLEAVLAEAADNLTEIAPLIAAPLSLSAAKRYPPLNLTPEAQKAKTFDALLGQVEGLAARRPVLMVLEDAHWMDPTTAELFGLIIDRIQRLPVLLLVTFRPEFSPPWAGYAHVTVLTLSRLGQRQGAQIVERLTGGKPLPTEVLEQILAKTDGVPLFVEELTKTVLDSGLLTDAGNHFELSGPLPPLAIPATLHDSLMARLDRLAPVKEVAQTGAVIGREFSYGLLAAVLPLGDNQLQDALAQLVNSELIFRRGAPPEATYTFKHSLVQDAAYESLLKSKRQQLHVRIAEEVEQRFPDLVENQPELLAQHFTDAGLAEQAINYWFAAGERALRASANVEAIKHLSQGVRLLASLPDTPERNRTELRFQTALGSTYLATRGWTASEAAEAYYRAEALCRGLGDSRERFKIVHGLWLIHVSRPDMVRARALSDELFRLAEQQNDDELRLQARHSAWPTHTWLGEFTTSQEHAEQGLALYDPAKHGRHALIYGGHDPGVCAWAQAGLALWFLGYPDRAAEHVRRSVLLAEQIAHPPSVAHALNYGILCHQWRRDEAVVGVWGDRLARVAAEQRLALHEATAVFTCGWVLANQGQARNSVAELRRALEGCVELGMRLLEPYFMASLAEAHMKAGDTAVGLEILEETMRFVNENGQRYWDAELLRLKGELLAGLEPGGDPGEVEGCYREALAVAQGQHARSLELRAATSLARLWADQGKRAQAHDLLAPVYGWFTEGFDTQDLKDAKMLIGELS